VPCRCRCVVPPDLLSVTFPYRLLLIRLLISDRSLPLALRRWYVRYCCVTVTLQACLRYGCYPPHTLLFPLFVILFVTGAVCVLFTLRCLLGPALLGIALPAPFSSLFRLRLACNSHRCDRLLNAFLRLHDPRYWFCLFYVTIVVVFVDLRCRCWVVAVVVVVIVCWVRYPLLLLPVLLVTPCGGFVVLVAPVIVVFRCCSVICCDWF